MLPNIYSKQLNVQTYKQQTEARKTSSRKIEKGSDRL
jgi:hypothetical protein